MQDKILYRNEWYTVSEYHARYVILEDEIGNTFNVPNKEIQAPDIKFCYA